VDFLQKALKIDEFGLLARVSAINFYDNLDKPEN